MYCDRIFSPERSQSMSTLSTQKEPPRMTHLESLEAKMANIEVSLSNTNTPRRRRGTSSLIGTSTIPADNVSMNSNTRHREAIIQNIRVQLTDNTEISKAEQELQKLRNDADKKRIIIYNLKTALENLDIKDNNIDIRIRQAEIEYALGREELQLLSLVEDIRAVQFRLDKTLKSANTSIYFQLKNGFNLSLYAVDSNLGRFGMNNRDGGLFVDWSLDGEALLKGDRIIECNGKAISSHPKEEIQKMVESTGRCQLVVIRKKNSQLNNQMLLQSQEDNQRLQHRISYLEDQVKDLLKSKDLIIPQQNHKPNKLKGDHITSISIVQDTDRPQVFQRGNFVATIIGGKAISQSISTSSNFVGCATSNANQTMNFRSQRNSLQGFIKKRDHKENHQSPFKKGDHTSDLRSAKSLEFEDKSFSKLSMNSSVYRKPRELDYTSEPVATPQSSSTSRKYNRPMPPKKPLRLSLQRTQSLQTIEANAAATIIDLERKRALKRSHRDGAEIYTKK